MHKKVLAAAFSASCLFTGVVGADLPHDSAEQSVASANAEKTWRFRVFLDDKEIGHHEFRVTPVGGGERVEVEAQFDVRFLFITAYSYTHENLETWQNGCLEAIQSRTDDNGEMLAVSGSRHESGFRVDSGGDTRLLETDCVQTFAYWNPAIVRAQELLNAQTGELTTVEILPRGPESIEVAGSPVDAYRYSITMEGEAIELWYRTEDQAWLALEAPAGGRTLRYEPLSVPTPPERYQRLPSDGVPAAF